MKKIGKEPLTQSERNKRYRESHKLSLFAVRIEKSTLDRLQNKLDRLNVTKKSFLEFAIKDFLDRFRDI